MKYNVSADREMDQKPAKASRSSPRPHLTAPAPALTALHDQMGNRAVGQLIQAKLTIGAPDDKYEQEADRVAEEVMRMPEPRAQQQVDLEDEEDKELLQTKPLASQITPLVQRQCACGGKTDDDEECEECQHKNQMLQRRAGGEGKDSVDTSSVENILRSPGRPLDSHTLAFMESRFGHDFGAVRVHTGTTATESARAVNAKAFTVGDNIVFDTDQYVPQGPVGQQLIAHELAHVIQQGNGRSKRSIQTNSVPLKQTNGKVVQRKANSWKGFPCTGKILSKEEIEEDHERGKLLKGRRLQGIIGKVWSSTVGGESVSLEGTDMVKVVSPTSKKWGKEVSAELWDGWLIVEWPQSSKSHKYIVGVSVKLDPSTAPKLTPEEREGHREETPPTSSIPPLRVGIIPVREFIQHVEMVERAYPTKSSHEILTMIRSLYYGTPAGSPGFDRLIPDAPKTGAVEVCTESEGQRCEEPVGTCVCFYAQGLAMDVNQLRSAVSRLRQHADENEITDNPSPYIEVGTELVDVGHLLVGVDAILHPRTENPFRSHGLETAPAPATWEGDVGAGMVYLEEHLANGSKSPDVKGNPSPTVQSYYRNSAPISDIIGDVDAFNMASQVGPQTLSGALRYYYVGESGHTTPRYQNTRWAGFCSAVKLTYTLSSGSIIWTQEARQLVIGRIMAFANLFQGRTRPLEAMTSGISPRQWPRAGNFADLFLADVKGGLEKEIDANAGL